MELEKAEDHEVSIPPTADDHSKSKEQGESSKQAIEKPILFGPSTTCEERFKYWLIQEPSVHRFDALKSHLGPDEPVEFLLRVLKDHGLLVQGLWVPKSTLLFQKDRDRWGRDFVLLEFRKSISIDTTELPTRPQVLVNAMKIAIEDLAVKEPTSDVWKFKEPHDTTFIERHPEIVKEQEEVWESLQKHIKGSLLDEDRETLRRALEGILQKYTVCSLTKIQQHLGRRSLSAFTDPEESSEKLRTVLNEVAFDIHGVYVSRSSDPQYKDFRNVIIQLLIDGGNNAKIKKASIMAAAKDTLKRDITDTEYRKVLQELCESKGSVWVLKSGAESEEARESTQQNQDKGKLQDHLKATEVRIQVYKKNINDSELEEQHAEEYFKKSRDVHTKPRSVEEVVKRIIKHEKSAASIYCQMPYNMAALCQETKGVLGIVATLGCVDDDNISWLLSEYLGLDTMLAVVCKTPADVKALETYDKKGAINKNSGIHKRAALIGQELDGHFQVICLKSLRQYKGGFKIIGKEIRLDLQKPTLKNGDTPAGFIDYAINMITLPKKCWTNDWEKNSLLTLFYNLFSTSQVYETKDDMSNAQCCINNGAISLDGGIMKRNGVVSLGNRMQLDDGVIFPKQHSVDSRAISFREMQWKKKAAAVSIEKNQVLLERANSALKRAKEDIDMLYAQD